MTLIGYLDRLSAPAGSSVDAMISSTVGDVWVDVVRLLHGDTSPAGPGSQTLRVDLATQRVTGVEQATHLGSCVVVEDAAPQPVEGTSISLFLQPTLARVGRRQAVVTLVGDARPSLALAIDESGALVLEVGGATVRLDVDWRRETWYRAEVEVDADRAVLRCSRVTMRPSGLVERPLGEAACAVASSATYSAIVFGAETCPRVGRRWTPTHCFNGKIENPVLRTRAHGEATVTGDWRFELSPESTTAHDISGAGRHGVVVNAPTRGMTGCTWANEVVDFTCAPDQFGAIHFHEDDLDDAGWEVSARLDLPDDLPSGLYGVRLRAGDEEDVIPLAITPSPAAGKARVAVLLPTFTYVAYANERMLDRLDFEGEQLTDHPVEPGRHDRQLGEHPEWGLSLYDLHSDGSTCVFSTHRRPIPNLRPDYRSWLQDAPRHLSADLYLVHWLTHLGQAFDVLTDHDLADQGVSLLEPYDVVITGSHPEYVSGGMLDAIQAHLDGGASLMYLGGNGFYWVTSQDPQRPHLIEVRRGPVGTRPSEGNAWEGVHSTTGEVGGLWRTRGRGPNRITGVGMTAQGWDEKAPGYRRMPDSHRPEAAFLFERIGDDEVIGDFGLIMNGASGDELDRFDVDRGSPQDTLVVARSTGHSDFYQLAGEDLLASRPGIGGAECDDVRSDMTLLRHDGGGWVFSVGSICFTGSISHNGYANNVARLLGNALTTFLRL